MQILVQRLRFVMIALAGLSVLLACNFEEFVPQVSPISAEALIPPGAFETYAGIERGTDSGGFPRLGSRDASIVVTTYSSFGCSHCKTFNEERILDIMDTIREGQVQFVFKPITFIANNDNNDAGKAARAAICAGDQGYFWEMQSILFHWQGTYSVTTDRLRIASVAVGLDTAQFINCYDSNFAEDIISKSEQEFRDQGYAGTPTVLVNDEVLANFAALESVVRDQIGN